MGETSPLENQRRWSQSLAYLREGRIALSEGRTYEALRLFTAAHDLGDDNTICHARGHFGRMRVELQTGKVRDALLDGLLRPSRGTHITDPALVRSARPALPDQNSYCGPATD